MTGASHLTERTRVRISSFVSAAATVVLRNTKQQAAIALLGLTANQRADVGVLSDQGIEAVKLLDRFSI